ncbi:MAG: trimethylamine methyltransferase family protein [Terriglobia bacterium]
MRPRLSLLTKELIEEIVSEGRKVLCTLGVEIHNENVVSLLADYGAEIDKERQRVRFTPDLIDRGLQTVPRAFRLYDALGRQTHDFSGDSVYFTPGSAAIRILDNHSGEMRTPCTGDYIRYVKLVSALPHLASQSTALIPADVHENISDSYRLYLSLLYGEKPVVTGAFTVESFEVMKDMQLVVRGNAKDLRARPMAIFTCCPTSPLKWTDVTSQNLLDCARWGIPIELVAVPLSGFMAPVTLVGTLIQHTAENLSGLVISQLAQPGTPVLYGSSSAIFDIRFETTPLGAIESMLLTCAASEIGKYLGMPTQGYISLSDAKQLDTQAGLETAVGALLATLCGINSISGPGMLDFESCQSLEKLVVDNEICGMAYRLLQGIEPCEDFPATPLLEELLREQHLLIADHTRRHLHRQVFFPGPVIDRASRSRWLEEGGMTLRDRAEREVSRQITGYIPSRLSDNVKAELTRLMEAEAMRVGMEGLPVCES